MPESIHCNYLVDMANHHSGVKTIKHTLNAFKLFNQSCQFEKDFQTSWI